MLQIYEFLSSHKLPLRKDNERDFSVNMGLVLDMLDFLPDDSIY